MLTVVIPALNEEERVAAAVRSAFEAGASEVIVVDGGSSDATVERARDAGARVLLGERMRAKQLNLGARAAANDTIIFLHADTLLPNGACAAVLASGAPFGGFRIAFAERSLRLRYVAFMINLRTRITRQPWGDQAQFVDRRAFPGFREIPIMEDYDLARRMKRGVILPLTVITSGRRFLQKGVVRTSFINWTTILRYHLGADVDALARRYRK
ncbi:MAG TPA: TIGR04283 family arsenosugar biosynthesis glycosyltransferase [Thermoanaerobaculia bacterium]|nr:TIGR04283 family arsenosugar biosynthesis glycosyltransferase [Thermoanaerobaculia bacterium]